ncbi:hypothetical protein G7B40_001630 [Aetokthonos hydrillicola Thurmond2011]|jgi:hypothetical protein|uniref:Uncharacterized protein n=1 Tax=Aetokthonos hydrillicola Thurmond2011 TaxID=2712845 RepID=A0AAP5I182_9CYAN|nr:hypothetical protein [Aetokthonos hydrillicola]MBO3462977.1 hypothetical protein [Aetokthonos hydrillicola CCALA 1050]MBW4591273.1 hypothetical protein [Aetokthonos hydrillicola CCALA 1050]MDR9893287.1 hypothetical protein [Aetokthonos hydrillicola Thurmond2011]
MAAGYNAGFGSYSPQQWQDYLKQNESTFQRQQQLEALQSKYGMLPSQIAQQSTGNQNTGDSSGFGSLFGNNSGLFGGGFGDWINTAKDLSNFQLGQNEKLAQFNLGLRNQEADSNFGRQYKLNQQEIQGTYDLNKMQQDATTNRLQSQLQNQSQMQQAGFNQDNLFRAQSAALAMRGLR